MLGIRRKNIQPTQAVCRCLFGPIDHQEVKKTLSRELARIEKENSETWNFDFRQERPVTGKFTWVQMKENDEVPVAYKMPNLRLSNYIAALLINQNSESTPATNTTSEETPSLETDVPSSTPNSQVRPSRKRKLSAKQCQITEYFPHKRKCARLEKPLH